MGVEVDNKNAAAKVKTDSRVVRRRIDVDDRNATERMRGDNRDVQEEVKAVNKGLGGRQGG